MLKLNVEKIRIEMDRAGIDEIELASRWGMTRQGVYDFLQRRPITQAERFAKVFGLDPKDLIVNE